MSGVLAMLWLLAAPDAGAASSPPEIWAGSVVLPGGAELGFTVTFLREGEQCTATLDIPAQGLVKGPLRDVSCGDSLRFTLAPPGAPASAWARFEAPRAEAGDKARGELRQHGHSFDLRMERVLPGEVNQRKQTPKPPFPYAAREVVFETPVDKAKLAGTLTVPAGDGPHPAVVLITGSGPQDRDETVFGHKPFLVLADHLSRRGFAVLRFDDRGVGASGGSADVTLPESAVDVLAAIRFLTSQKDIDAKRIGLIGHSEGGIVAPLAAAKSQQVAFVVLLAGSGVPGRDILSSQMEKIFRAKGLTDAQIAPSLAAQKALLDKLAANAAEKELRSALTSLVQAQTQLSGAELPPAQLEEVVTAHLGAMKSKRMRSFVKLDPADALKKLKVPVLALGGTLDLQVPVEQNLPKIEAALSAGGNTDYSVVSLPGLNHLFQAAETGLPDEYAGIEETINPAVLERISTWLRQRAGLEPR